MAEELSMAISDVVESGEFVGGKHVVDFERRFAREVSCTNFCAGVGSGTDALQLAIEALCGDEGEKNEIIVQANTFAATAEAIVRAGFEPVFVDVRLDTLQVGAREIAAAITKKTAAIVVVHLFGVSPNMDDIMHVADSNGIPVVEDCAQAHGSTFEFGGRMRVAGSVGSVSCFSFYPGKTLGAIGDGGAVCTDDHVLHDRVIALRNHGSVEKYVHDVVGTTSRLDAIQASVLSAKLNFLQEWIEKRSEIADFYGAELGGMSSVRVIEKPFGTSPSWHLYPIRVSADARDQLRAYLSSVGIETGVHYPIALHKQKAFEPFAPGVSCTRAETASSTSISIPIFPEMTYTEAKYVCDSVKNFFDTDYRRS
jgi:dTDP-4-amino-4,6-dideoxygalactose transaminase